MGCLYQVDLDFDCHIHLKRQMVKTIWNNKLSTQETDIKLVWNYNFSIQAKMTSSIKSPSADYPPTTVLLGGSPWDPAYTIIRSLYVQKFLFLLDNKVFRIVCSQITNWYLSPTEVFVGFKEVMFFFWYTFGDKDC